MADGMFGAIGASGGAAMETAAGIIGFLISSGQREKAMQLYKDSLENIKGIDLPAFENLISHEAQKQPDVNADPAVREAQMGALSKMQGLANAGGLDPQAQAQLQASRGSMEQAISGNNQAIRSQMNRRGMSGSGDELSAMLSGAQGAGARGNQAGLDIASQARMRALDALKSTGSMAGDIRAGDFGEGNANRNAEFERNKFNANMRTAAQYGNNQNRQMLFDAKAKKAAMLSKANSDLGQQYYNQGDREQRLAGGIGRGMNKISSEGGQMADSMMKMYGGGG